VTELLTRSTARAAEWTPERILESDRRYVIRSWSQQGKPAQAVVTHGE